MAKKIVSVVGEQSTRRGRRKTGLRVSLLGRREVCMLHACTSVRSYGCMRGSRCGYG